MIRPVIYATLILTLLVAAVFAEPFNKTYVLTDSLVEEIFKNLSKQPYAEVAPIIGKLQAEIQRQPTVAPTPPSKP